MTPTPEEHRQGELRGGETPPAEQLQGTVERVTYADPTSLYLVLRIAPEKGYEPPAGASSGGALFRPALSTAVGRGDAPAEGLRVRLTGRWIAHKTHGQQFEFDLLEALAPGDRAGLVKYLASSRFKGIGPKLAERIVAALGEKALEIALEHPERLAGIKGMKPALRDAFVAALLAEHGTHGANVFLRGLGLGPWQASAVLRKLGPECEANVRADPYVLASGIAGIGFGTADRVAESLGLAPDDPRRARAGIVQALKAAAEEGHSMLPRERLAREARELLSGNVDEAVLASALAEAERTGEVVVERSAAGPEHARAAVTRGATTEAASVGRSARVGATPASDPATTRPEVGGVDRASTREEEPERARRASAQIQEEDRAADAAARAEQGSVDERAGTSSSRASTARTTERAGHLGEAGSQAPTEEHALEARARAPADDSVWLPHLHRCESELARNLGYLLRAGPARPWADASTLALAERHASIELHPLQREAVLGLLATPVGLLTGGPGVGKTTIVRLVVELARSAQARILLASPTGRAAKRLSEATGHPAQTIHRLLGWEPATGSFLHDARNPLEADLVVVDEISMLDVALAHHLVKAIQPPTRVIFVGDPNQLPSVGPGNVLHDLIESGAIPVRRLTQIYRQAEDSLIVANAHRILSGEMPVLPPKGDRGSDFYFFHEEDPARCAELLVDVVTRRIPETFGMSWIDDVQVIAPMYRGECGVDALNERLREELAPPGNDLWSSSNEPRSMSEETKPTSRRVHGGEAAPRPGATELPPARKEIRQGGRVWREGDRVIHTRNDYEKEVFNGDMGRVARVIDGAEPSLIVQFPEREVSYSADELGDLQPAFAITVHRSQGGEFPAIVMPLVPQHWMMLQRHLLYTAVTRAKKLVVLVGSRRALRMAIENAEQAGRESALAERLRRQEDRGYETTRGIPS